MDYGRIQRILTHPNKRVSGRIEWQKKPGRNVVAFEVAVETDLDEQLCLAGEYVPTAGFYKLQLFAGQREPIYRYESAKKHHTRECPWIVGPHVNYATPDEPRHGELEREIPGDDIRGAIRAFAKRLGIGGIESVPLPPEDALQLDMEA